MKHWLFIIITCLLFSAYPMPFSKGQMAVDTNVKSKVIGNAIINKEQEKQQLLEALKDGHDDIADELNRINKKVIPVVAVASKAKPKIKYITKRIIDTEYVVLPCPDPPLREAIKPVKPVKIIPVVIKDTVVVKKKTAVGKFLKRIF